MKAKHEKRFTKGIQRVSVEAHVAWDYEYCDAQSRSIDAEWVSSGVPSFRVRGGRIGPDTLISGVNLRLSVTNPLSVTTGYNFAANPDYVSHSFSVGVNLAFLKRTTTSQICPLLGQRESISFVQMNDLTLASHRLNQVWTAFRWPNRCGKFRHAMPAP